MAEHYPFFDLHGVNWPDRRSLAPKADDISDAELAAILVAATQGLDDGHVQLTMGAEGFHSPERSPGWWQENPGLSRHALWDVAADTIGADLTNVEGTPFWYGLRADGIGYIQIREMEVQTRPGQTLGDVASKAMGLIAEQIETAGSVIVDVRYNPGGSDSVAMAIAGHFAASPTATFHKAVWTPQGLTEPFDYVLTPAPDRRLKQPIVLLTSELTGSGAEIFTLAMRNLPQVTTMGGRTSGGLSDILEFTLPNGWTLGLSFQEYRSADGGLFEGPGIPPDKGIATDGANLLSGQDRVLAAAIGFFE